MRDQLASLAATETERNLPADVSAPRFLISFYLPDALADAIALGLGERRRDRQEQLGEPIPASEAKQSGESAGALRPPGSPRRASGRSRPQQLSPDSPARAGVVTAKAKTATAIEVSFIVRFPFPSGRPNVARDATNLALLKAQTLLFSAKNLFEQDRMTPGGEAGLTT
jgi:hypothetical protein